MDPHPTSRTLDAHINHLAAVEQLGEVTVTLDISILFTDVGSAQQFDVLLHPFLGNDVHRKQSKRKARHSN